MRAKDIDGCICKLIKVDRSLTSNEDHFKSWQRMLTW